MNSTETCVFCKSGHLNLLYVKRYHPFNKAIGPVDFYKCENCGSGVTIPLPSPEDLKFLYASFSGGMNPHTRTVRTKNPLNAWYNQCVERAVAAYSPGLKSDDIFSWIDIGAGDGEVAKIMSITYPHSSGFAIDFHPRPDALNSCSNIEWLQCDLNCEDFYKALPKKDFDIALSITVLEHVLNPGKFLENISNLVNNKGAIYITCPDMGSLFSRILGRFWPYLIFGEHLNIPSKTGLRYLFNKNKSIKFSQQNKIVNVDSVILPYPITYYLDHFHVGFLSRLLPRGLTLKMNTGILELSISPGLMAELI